MELMGKKGIKIKIKKGKVNLGSCLEKTYLRFHHNWLKHYVYILKFK